MKFVHAADLHLDSPLRGLERHEGAPVERIRAATRRAMERLVEACIQEEVSLLLIAGDLYDGDWTDYSTGLFFAKQTARLKEAKIRVVWLRGNHDAKSKLTKYLAPSSNVHELPYAEPGSVVFEDLGVAIHGQGYPRARVDQDLTSRYPDPIPSLFNIGMLHTALDGRPGHDPYAPCGKSSLVAKGYEYWALGHVHTREIVSEAPWIVFPGNLQGRHARETGAKGATLVEVDGQRVNSVEALTLDVVRFDGVCVDVTGTRDLDEVLERAQKDLERAMLSAEGRLCAVRVLLSGASPAHAELTANLDLLGAQMQGLALDVGDGQLWIERVRVETTPEYDEKAILSRDDAVGQVARALNALGSEPASLAELAELLPQRGIPPELLSTEDGLRYTDPDRLRVLLKDVERLLVPSLINSEGES